MRHVLAMVLVLVFAPSCGDGDDGGDPGVCDEDGGESCFELPTAAALVTPEGQSTTAANFDCGPDDPGTLPGELTVTGTIKDYLTRDGVAGATLDIFYDNVIDASSDQTVTADGTGAYSYTLPAGTSRVVAGVVDAAGDYVSVRGYRARYNENSANTDVSLYVLTRNSANQIYGLVGIPPDTSTGVATMLISDCDGEDIENVVGTLSTTSSADGAPPTFVPGSYVFYGAEGDVPAPVRRNVRNSTANNGVVFVFNVPPGTYFEQIWGFPSEADVALGRDGLALLAEYPIEVIADAASGTLMRPSEGPL